MIVVEPEGIVVVGVGCLGGEVREGVVVGEIDEVEVANGLVGVDVVARGGEDGELAVGRQRSGRGTSKGEHELGGQGLEGGGCGGDHGDDGGGGEDESHDGRETGRTFYTFFVCFLFSVSWGVARRQEVKAEEGKDKGRSVGETTAEDQKNIVN